MRSLITSRFLSDLKKIKISVNTMKFVLAQVTFSLANSQFADNSGHSLPPGLRVPDSVRNQFKTLPKEQKRVQGKIWYL